MTGATHLFAIEALQLAAPSVFAAAEGRIPEAMVQRYWERQQALLASLLGHDTHLMTLDLRVSVTPEPSQPSMGTTRLALIVRFDGLSSDEAAVTATDLHRALLALHPETDWRLVPGTELPQLLQPFAATHVATVSRRTLGVNAPANPDAQKVGFLARNAIPEDDQTLYHTYVGRMLLGEARLDSLCRLLLLGEAPVLLSIRMHAEYQLEATLTELDENVQSGLRLLEKSMMAGSGNSAVAGSVLKATLSEGLRRRLALQDGGVLARITLSSSGRIPASVLTALEHFFTTPARTQETSEFLGHGTMVASVRPATPADREAAGTLPLGSVEADGGRHLFSREEAMALMVLPPPATIEFLGIAVRRWKRVPVPAVVGHGSTPLGLSDDAGTSRLVGIAPLDRLRHQYVIGATGTGKSTLLLNAILADLEAGRGLAVFDPQRDGSLSVRLFGDHGACPLKSALVRLETPNGVSLSDLESRTNDEGRVTLTVSPGAPSRGVEDGYLIITIPAGGE